MAPSEAAIRRALWGLLILVMAGVIGGGVVSLLRGRTAGGTAAGEDPPRAPVYGRVPPFSLVERSGGRVERSDLQGKVWIADFIYTRCTETCPLQSARMARLQADFAGAPDVRLVSFTVDPVWDTPRVLARYAARFGADPARWLFLTGDKTAILRLAREGFRLGVEEEPAGTGRSPLEKAFPPDRTRAPGGSRRATLDVGRWAGYSPLGVAPALAHEAGPEGAAPAPGRGPILHSSRFVLVDRRGRIRGYYEGGDDEALQRLRQAVEILLTEPAP